MKSKLFFLIIYLSFISFSQQEKERWEELKDPYLNNTIDTEEIDKPVGSVFINSVVSVYRFFISDQDGDNCPFHPSCSQFLIESVRETNILQGILMTGDRFTRDMNIIDRMKRYPIVKKQRFYDPPELYTLDNPEYPPRLK